MFRVLLQSKSTDLSVCSTRPPLPPRLRMHHVYQLIMGITRIGKIRGDSGGFGEIRGDSGRPKAVPNLPDASETHIRLAPVLASPICWVAVGSRSWVSDGLPCVSSVRGS